MAIKMRLLAIGILIVSLVGAIEVMAAVHPAVRYPPPFPRQAAAELFENDRVVVWDVTWPKGHLGPMHEHYRDAIIVTLTGGSVKKMPLRGRSAVVTYKAGSVIFARRGVIHREEGVSTTPRHAIVIELK